MDDEFTIPDNAICYLNSARGQYIPRDFFIITKPECINWKCDDETKTWILDQCSSTKKEFYWDAWNEVDTMERLTVTNPDTGVECFLWHDEDLWLIPLNSTDVAEVNKHDD